ncbi:glycosyltransferase [Candidatus Parcubacteria bacterium]|nr:MAG: glycosyltransferase [Candidatus Parcubacteria bacterium]
MNQGRKKVLFLITKATWGGAQRYVHDLATHLPAEQFDVGVAFGDRGTLATMLEEKNIRTHFLPSLSRNVALFSDITSFFQILALLRQTRPDVLHVNSSKAAALGALAARIVRTKRIIFTAHGWPFKEDRSPLSRSLIYCVSWLTAFLSHATIVVSKRDETIGKQMPLIGEKVRHIPIGIEAPTFLAREEAATSLSIAATKPRVVTIAELTTNKGISYAIDAVAALKKRNVHVEYFVMGDGELRGELEAQARERDVSDRVHFLGFVANASKYLKAFDVFLLPSIKEGMPYVLLEAMAAGLPILTTDAVDTTYVRQVESRNTMALAVGIEKIHRIKVTAEIRFTLQEMIENTLRLY